jgi:hypothetical protein
MASHDETASLRHRVMRLRTALRLAKDSRVEAILREVIADQEERLIALEHRAFNARAFTFMTPPRSH